jgi:hypothetical protein
MKPETGIDFEKSFLFERRWRSAVAFRNQVAQVALEGESNWREDLIKCLQTNLKEYPNE